MKEDHPTSSVMAVDPVGSGQIFSWIAELTGIHIDLVNFLASQLVALALSPLFRTVLHPTKASPAARHAFGLVVGLALGYFCFGKRAFHLAALPALCYVVMRTQHPRVMQRTVLSVAMFYLSCVHAHRMMYDYGFDSVDITGPLMVITQKVTSLAFSLHDGLARAEEDLTPSQKLLVVRSMPSPMEYFSYMFHFQALIVGPVIFYPDYMEFICGQNFKKHRPPNTDGNSNTQNVVLEPSALLVVLKKVSVAMCFGLLYVRYQPQYHIDTLKDPEFVESTSAVSKMGFLLIATTVARFKYYHAWLLADGICNASGLGFNGYRDGKSQWDLISNVNVVKFETGLSLRDSIEQWNIGTTRWLRMVVFERTPGMRTLSTYALSALWHGFYPGYYLTFLSGAFFTFVSRTVRRSVRHRVLSPVWLKMIYDFLTLLTTRITMAYITFSFVLLDFWPSIIVYWNLYIWLHVVGLVALVVLPHILTPQCQPARTKEERGESTQNGRLLKSNGELYVGSNHH